MWQETLEIIKHVDDIGVLTKPKAIEDMLPFNSQEKPVLGGAAPLPPASEGLRRRF